MIACIIIGTITRLGRSITRRWSVILAAIDHSVSHQAPAFQLDGFTSSMSSQAKLVASEILMCGLKRFPFGIGVAFEVVEAVRNRFELLDHSERLAEVEAQMSRMERRMRDLVQEEIRTTLEHISQPGLDGPSLTREVQNLRDIQAHGWNPSLFEGIIRNSTHWEELRRHPQNYGRVLDDQATLDGNSIRLLIEPDRMRVLELTPFSFASLLAKQPRGVPSARIQSSTDIWAFPATAGTKEERQSSTVPRSQLQSKATNTTTILAVESLWCLLFDRESTQGNFDDSKFGGHDTYLLHITYEYSSRDVW